MSKLTKTLFIGLDAADKDLMIEWANAGYLPNIKALLESSACMTTQNPEGLYVGAIWPSFYTGVSPARHGRYCYEQLVSGSYTVQRFSPRDLKVKPFWEQLDRRGKKVAVIDVPKTFASELENSMQIVDWGSHDPDPVGFSSWPSTLAAQIDSQFGSDDMHNCNAFRETDTEFIAFRDHLLERIQRKTALDLHFLKQGGWDSFVTVFSESHCVGHQCWHLHDAQHQKHNPALTKKAGNPIQAIYTALDHAVGQLVNAVDDDTHIALFASHGMGPHYDATFMLDDILSRLDGEKPKKDKSYLVPLIKPMWQLLPEKLRKRAKPLRKHVKVGLGVDKADITESQRAKSHYFRVPNNDAYGGVRINLAGREPQGRVSPDDYDEICKTLTADLMSFTNFKTGEPLVKKVLRSVDIYEGECLHYLPDLLVEWNRSQPISEIYSSKTGKINGTYKKCRTGDHKSDGLFLLRGPGIMPCAEHKAVSVMDIAPTLAALADVELANVEGRSVLPMLSKSGL